MGGYSIMCMHESLIMCMHESRIIFVMAFSKIITGGNQHKQAMLNPSNKTHEIGS